MIKAENIHFSVGSKQILKPVHIELSGPGITVVLGPNGAGKSTLLKCLSGANRLSGGTVSIDGKTLQAYSRKELALRRAVLSQSTEIAFPFKVHEVVLMGRNPHVVRGETEADHKIIEQALQHVDALDLRDREFSTLSGGEKQRVQLARVLAQVWERKGALLMLDEPTSALDLRHQSQILGYVRRQVEQFGMTVLCILHDINLAAAYADRIILMKDGEIVKHGDAGIVLTSENLSAVYDIPVSRHELAGQARFFID